jgi:hypothetical protein
MPDNVIRWDGILEDWSYRSGFFYTTVDIKDPQIAASSAVTASASEAGDEGGRFLGDAIIIVGAIVPYAGGAHVQIGTSTNDFNPSQVRLAITLTVAPPA